MYNIVISALLFDKRNKIAQQVKAYIFTFHYFFSRNKIVSHVCNLLMVGYVGKNNNTAYIVLQFEYVCVDVFRLCLYISNISVCITDTSKITITLALYCITIYKLFKIYYQMMTQEDLRNSTSS